MADRYSFSLTTFSPSGKLVQIEYALNAVASGFTSIGIKASNGVVIATEKKLSSILISEDTVVKAVPICDTIGLVYSGMTPDAKVLIDRARKAAQSYRRVFNEEPPVLQLVRDIASVMQEYTQSGGVRPFGVSLLVAGHDHNGPALYQVDPSGSYFAWKAAAIGKNMLSGKTFLEKRYTENIDLTDAIYTAILALKEGFEGELTENNIEVAVVAPAPPEAASSAGGVVVTGGNPDDPLYQTRPIFRRLTPAEIKDYLVNI
ncbi:proteasome subunit alpha type-2-B [Fonticula alba]|uniref:Proteasome subunit alpha type n=1 Tax=Fonticula alba TaxID=691883 RepID=A0A058Z423_FONAL|nr:proteasome subunit alpha type-2-B [Fonticula alba]KCV68678.1 proteasome subunit alpha type-2-B [Fonticula alba]|eukprot:XP_009497110.1 proteasome subunit alpha type-2-B [Fonticula alba]